MNTPLAPDDLDIVAPKKKRKKPVSATAMTLKEIRKRGWIAQVVEQTIPRVFIKRDLFGVIDIIAIGVDNGIASTRPIGIQATVGDRHADHRAKILAEPRARVWVTSGAGLELWSWSKQGARGKRKLWTLRIEQITAEMFATPAKEAA